MRKHPTCQRSDRDQPKLVCGYPLPCPHHTAEIDLGASPPTVTVPATPEGVLAAPRLAQIAHALGPHQAPLTLSETPEEKARRLGVTLIPVRTPLPKLHPDVVAVCGKCGREIGQIDMYVCSDSECPLSSKVSLG
jgi:hypothetical protein